MVNSRLVLVFQSQQFVKQTQIVNITRECWAPVKISALTRWDAQCKISLLILAIMQVCNFLRTIGFRKALKGGTRVKHVRQVIPNAVYM